MRRRSRVGGKSLNTRHRKTRKPGKGPKVVRRRSASGAGRESEVARLTRKLNEAQEQQAAATEVLHIISSSFGDLKVFAVILENATRLCDAKLGALYLREADRFRAVALHGVSPVQEEKLQGRLTRPPPTTVLGRLSRTKATAHIADVLAEPGFFDTPPGFDGPQLAIHAGARTLLGVPMLKENELVGGFLIYRQEGRPFGDTQVALLENFAAQAVIAIENARLLGDLRQRTADLVESLRQQTATPAEL